MAVKILFNPILAFTFFMIGMWLGSTIHISFGFITILGGLLFGFSPIRHDVEEMEKKTKLLFFGAFIFLLILMSAGFYMITTFFL